MVDESIALGQEVRKLIELNQRQLDGEEFSDEVTADIDGTTVRKEVVYLGTAGWLFPQPIYYEGVWVNGELVKGAAERLSETRARRAATAIAFDDLEYAVYIYEREPGRLSQLLGKIWTPQGPQTLDEVVGTLQDRRRVDLDPSHAYPI